MLAYGDMVGEWRVVSALHEGNLAVTYEVSRQGDGGRYALKLLHLRDPQFQERLRRTAVALSSFSHPNLVGVVATVEHDGAPGVVSRFVEGDTLDTWAASGRSVAEVLRVVRGIADGLQAAHGQGLIHRNLKPQKVLIDPSGEPRVHDFLLGKVMGVEPSQAMTQMGTTFGTPQYMSPEQFRGAGAVDERADLFSLGCLAYEMLTGERAFDGSNLMAIYGKVLDGDRVDLAELRPDVPPAVVALIDELLAPERDDRPSSAAAVVSRLDGDADLRAARGLAAGVGAGETITPPHDTLVALEEELLRPPPRVPEAAEPAEAVPTEAPVIDPEGSAPVPPPPPLVQPANEGVWLALLGLTVAALVIAVVVAALVISAG